MEQEQKPLTFDEILTDKDYQAEFDRRVNKAIETATNNAKSKWEEEFKVKMEKERTEAEKLANMKESEKHKYELEQERLAKESAINELNAYKLRDEAFKIAKEKGLDTSLLEDIDFSKQNAETITTIIDTNKQVFDKALEKAINERYKEKTPENVSSSSPSTKELPMFF